MRRRDFITVIIGSAALWPSAAQAQQGDRLRRVGVLTSFGADDPEEEVRIASLARSLQQLGWTIGRNVRLDVRSGGVDVDQIRKLATELIALRPDVILASGSTNVRVAQRASREVPIVFVSVTDPVGGGLIASLARPGANTTGFTSFEYGVSAKWLGLLKQIAPSVERVAIIRDSADASTIGQFAAVQSVAPTFDVEFFPVGVAEPGEIEAGLKEFERAGNGGLIVTSSRLAGVHRALIIKLAAQYRLPAVYPFRYYAALGGLISYGPDSADQWRLAGGYVDRILKGEKPADLPVQAPTKYDLVINLKTAKALGLAVPPALIAAADEVIE